MPHDAHWGHNWHIWTCLRVEEASECMCASCGGVGAKRFPPRTLQPRRIRLGLCQERRMSRIAEPADVLRTDSRWDLKATHAIVLVALPPRKILVDILFRNRLGENAGKSQWVHRSTDAPVFVMEMQRPDDGWAHEGKRKRRKERKKNLNHEFSLVSYSSEVWSRVIAVWI